MSLIDPLQTAAQGYERIHGVRVIVKTNLWPAYTVYNSDTANVSAGGFNFVKAGVRVTDRQGNVLAEYGGWPSTNWPVVGIAAAGILVAGIALLRGLKRGR